MPGAKRRALKKLLSPPAAGIDPSSPSSSSLNSSDATPPSAPPLGYNAGGLNENALIHEMEAKENLIGTPASADLSAVSGETGAIPPPSKGTALPPVTIPSTASANNHKKSSSSPTSSVKSLPTKSPRSPIFSLPKFGNSSGSSSSTTLFGSSGQNGKGGSAYTAEDLMDAQPGGGLGGAQKGGKKKSSKQRFLEREARKKEAVLATAQVEDPAVTARIEKEKKEEEQVMAQACKELGVELHDIEADGSCMYSAIADQLYILGLVKAPTYSIARHAAASYLRQNPDMFMPFLPSVLGEDMAGATDDGVMTEAGYAEYCKRVEQSGDWGGECEIQALSRYFDIPIHVIQRGPPTIIAHVPGDTGSGPMSCAESLAVGKAVRISYHRRMYGLGEHYNSLRPKKGSTPESLPMSGLAIS